MSLTLFLQDEFKNNCPDGWVAFSEVPLLSPSIAALLGYSPRVDVLLENVDQTVRYWIEFEISRADPVANHAKFATAHLFEPQSDKDVFFSMVSSHVVRGRHNLAANAIFLMRAVGMRAFQTVLLPHIAPTEVKRLNHLPSEELARLPLNPKTELDRVFQIAERIPELSQHQIDFVANYSEVMLNVYRWNEEMSVPDIRAQWRKRTVTYFVYNPQTKLFAPSKFCAFLPFDYKQLGMRVSLYTSLDETETRFDGTIARKHLVDTLGMIQKTADEVPDIDRLFKAWIKQFDDVVNLHPRGHFYILPPSWYR